MWQASEENRDLFYKDLIESLSSFYQELISLKRIPELPGVEKIYIELEKIKNETKP